MNQKFPEIMFGKTNVDAAENQGSNSEESKAILKGFRVVVLIGRLLGVFSRTDVLSEHEQKRKFNIASVVTGGLAFFTLLNAVLLFIHNVKKFQVDSTTLVRVEGFQHVVYACSMSFVYCYQFFCSIKFRSIALNFLHDCFPDRRSIFSFTKFCVMISFVCLFLGITENALFDWQNLSQGVKPNEAPPSILELSYINYFDYWHLIIPHYNGVVTFVLIALIKVCTWGWLHMDTICIVLCRALWEKLNNIYENLTRESGTIKQNDIIKVLSEQLDINGKEKRAQPNWNAYQDEYIKITRLVEQVESYISPIMLACYAGNIYILIVMLFNWIGPFSLESNMSKEQLVHVGFAFFQYSFRVATITYFAAEVHQMCLSLRNRIQSCPNLEYSISVERLENMLLGNPTGICLLGSFMITRTYLISIISFIFTTEIVLLQSFSTIYVTQTQQ